MSTANPHRSARRVESTPEICAIADLIHAPHRVGELGDLDGADFHDQQLGRLFDAVKILVASDFPVSDGVALMRALIRMPSVPTDVKEPGFIADLLRQGMGYHLAHHATEIRRDARMRRLRMVSETIVRKLEHTTDGPDEITEWILGELSVAGIRTSAPVERIGQVARRIASSLREQRDVTGRTAATGLYALDQVTGSWHGGEVVIIAARPGCGKTAMAAQIAKYNASRQRRSLYVSLEMDSTEIVQRIMCSDAGINGRLLRSGDANAQEREELASYEAEYDGLPLYLWSPPAASMAQIRAVARREHATDGGLSCLLIDYVQLIKPTSNKVPREEQVAEISRDVKRLAKELRVPVFLLAQLNRQADIGEPRLSHLRESGSLEADADAVIFLHRRNYEDRETEVIIAKNRSGAIGNVKLGWLASETRFVSEAPKKHEEFKQYAAGGF